MSTLTRWDPMRELEEIQSWLSGMFGRSPKKKNGEQQEALHVAEWAPLVDITEDFKEYFIKAELPEIKKDDIKISSQHDVLVISEGGSMKKRRRTKSITGSNGPMAAFPGALRSPKMPILKKSAPNLKKACSRSTSPKAKRSYPKTLMSKCPEETVNR